MSRPEVVVRVDRGRFIVRQAAGETVIGRTGNDGGLAALHGTLTELSVLSAAAPTSPSFRRTMSSTTTWCACWTRCIASSHTPYRSGHARGSSASHECASPCGTPDGFSAPRHSSARRSARARAEAFSSRVMLLRRSGRTSVPCSAKCARRRTRCSMTLNSWRKSGPILRCRRTSSADGCTRLVVAHPLSQRLGEARARQGIALRDPERR